MLHFFFFAISYLRNDEADSSPKLAQSAVCFRCSLSVCEFAGRERSASRKENLCERDEEEKVKRSETGFWPGSRVLSFLFRSR